MLSSSAVRSRRETRVGHVRQRTAARSAGDRPGADALLSSPLTPAPDPGAGARPWTIRQDPPADPPTGDTAAAPAAPAIEPRVPGATAGPSRPARRDPRRGDGARRRPHRPRQGRGRRDRRRGRAGHRARRAGLHPRRLRGLPARHRRRRCSSASGSSARWAGACSTASCCSLSVAIAARPARGRRSPAGGSSRWLAVAIVIGDRRRGRPRAGPAEPGCTRTIGDRLGVAVEPGVRPLVVGVIVLGLLIGLIVGIVAARPDERVRRRSVRRPRRADRPRRRRSGRSPRSPSARRSAPASASPSATSPGWPSWAPTSARTGIDVEALKDRFTPDPDHRNQQGDARVAAETDAARDRVLAARAGAGRGAGDARSFRPSRGRHPGQDPPGTAQGRRHRGRGRVHRARRPASRCSAGPSVP